MIVYLYISLTFLFAVLILFKRNYLFSIFDTDVTNGWDPIGLVFSFLSCCTLLSIALYSIYLLFSGVCNE